MLTFIIAYLIRDKRLIIKDKNKVIDDYNEKEKSAREDLEKAQTLIRQVLLDYNNSVSHTSQNLDTLSQKLIAITDTISRLLK